MSHGLNDVDKVSVMSEIINSGVIDILIISDIAKSDFDNLGYHKTHVH